MTVVAYKSEEGDQPVALKQAELNDLTIDLNLSKKSAQLLGSLFKINICWHQKQPSTGIETMREK